MPARDSLHYQVLMRDGLDPGGLLGSMLDAFERSQRGLPLPDGQEPMIESVANPIGMFAPRVPYDESGDGLRKYWARMLDLSLPFYVDPRMNVLITAAAASLPEDTKVQMHDLPNSHGFMLVPGGVAEVDLRGQLMVHNAIAWFQRAGGVDVWLLSSKYDPKDMVNARHRAMFSEQEFRMFPELMPASYMRIEFGAGIPWGLGSSKTLPPEMVEQLVVHREPDGGSLAYSWPEGYDMNEWLAQSMEMRPSGPMLWLYSVWRLMQQTITDVRTEPVERGLRKAAEKRKMKTAEVTVIHLRKHKQVDPEGPEQHIEWSHSWLVRGHWRQQPYGTRKDRAVPHDGTPGSHRVKDGACMVPGCTYKVVAIWIHPFMKGPEDAPLLVRDHVYSLDR